MDCNERIEDDLIEYDETEVVWVDRSNEGGERRADGRLCHFLQARSRECETIHGPHAYSWIRSRTAASELQDKIHVFLSRSAEEGGRIDGRGELPLPLWSDGVVPEPPLARRLGMFRCGSNSSPGFLISPDSQT